MEFRHIMYQPGKVARIIFNRPGNLSAQGYLLLEEVDQAFKQALSDEACGAIVLSGAAPMWPAQKLRAFEALAGKEGTLRTG